jgi:hypothetical protein
VIINAPIHDEDDLNGYRMQTIFVFSHYFKFIQMDIEHYELANQIELIGIEMRNSLRQVAFSEMSASATQIRQGNF